MSFRSKAACISLSLGFQVSSATAWRSSMPATPRGAVRVGQPLDEEAAGLVAADAGLVEQPEDVGHVLGRLREPRLLPVRSHSPVHCEHEEGGG